MTTKLYRTIPEQIAETLRRDIISGRLAADMSLREQELSVRFAVSRGPVRDALARLVQQGLIVSEPNKGVRVARAPSNTVRPLVTKIRCTIEVFALDSGFEKITPEDTDHWDSILQDLRSACERRDVNELREIDIRFHEAIIQSHDERDLHALWQPVTMRTMIVYSPLGNLMDSYMEHRAILDAIRAGDKSAAIRALESNIV